MLWKLVLEGLLLGALLLAFCALGIRNGAVNLVFLYHMDVQDRCVRLGLSSWEKIRRGKRLFSCFAVVWLLLAPACVYGLNGARGFAQGFWQLLAVLETANLVDRLLIDEYWVCRTRAWIIPGTEDQRPYITTQEKYKKWFASVPGFAALSALFAGIMALVLK